ncbi:hypothetical protein BGX26_003493, partial [Mortierella sp. AD094]
MAQIKGWVGREHKRMKVVPQAQQDRQLHSAPDNTATIITDWTSKNKGMTEDIFQESPYWNAKTRRLVQEVSLNLDQTKKYLRLRRAEERFLELTGAVTRQHGETRFSSRHSSGAWQRNYAK